MKGFSLLTNDIWGERHTKSTQGDSASAVRLAWRHLFISVHDVGVLPYVSLLSVFCSILLGHRICFIPQCNNTISISLLVSRDPLKCSCKSPPTDVSLSSWFPTNVGVKKQRCQCALIQCIRHSTDTESAEYMIVQELLWNTSYMLIYYFINLQWEKSKFKVRYIGS